MHTVLTNVLKYGKTVYNRQKKAVLTPPFLTGSICMHHTEEGR